MKRLVALPLVFAAACSTQPKGMASDASPPATSTPTATSTPSATASANRSDTPLDGEARGGGLAAPAEPTASATAAPVALPNVDVTNIGMHVGGGKNDAAEKAPIKTAVAPHMDAFKACFAKVDDLAKGGDFGVDLKIPREGGKPEVSHPRTSLKGDGFKECVLSTFEGVTFDKPKGGAMTVSYSLRFAPKK